MSAVVDLTPVATVLAPYLAAAALAAIGVLVPAVLKRFGVANNSDLTSKLTTALDAAAGEAYRVALTHEGGLANLDVHNAAVAAGVQYIVTNLPDTLKALGVTQDTVESMVKARLGSLLASDPTVTAGAPIPVKAIPVTTVA